MTRNARLRDAPSPFFRKFTRRTRRIACRLFNTVRPTARRARNYPLCDSSRRAYRFVANTMVPSSLAREFSADSIGSQLGQPNSPLQVLADSTARRFVSGVAWHCYGGEVATQSVVRDAHPDKDVFFTECSGGAWAPRFADNLVWTVRNLIIGATRNWARGVLMWNLALDEQHGPHLGGCGDCRGIVTINSSSGAVTRNEETTPSPRRRFVRPARDACVELCREVCIAWASERDVVPGAVVVHTNPNEKAFAVR